MISIRVTTFQQAAAAPLEARFGEAGGTIGRAPDNDLVLAEGDQSISRVQARIVCHGRAFAIVDQGGNATALNGQLLVNGRESPLVPGDELRMGEYVLRVEAVDANPAAAPASAVSGIPLDWDPFADDDQPAVQPSSTPASQAAARLVAAAPVWSPPPSTAPYPSTGTPAGHGPAKLAAGLGRVADLVAPPGAVLSWMEASGESTTTIRSEVPAVGALPSAALPSEPSFAFGDEIDFGFDFTPAAVEPPAAPLPAPAPAPAPPVSATRAAVQDWAPPPSLAPSSSSASAEMAELVEALREGLGLDEMPGNATTLTPALMRMLGSLVQEATRGTIELLVARAALKSEIRAEVTVIAVRENNPLKFSPSADVALGHLLGPPTPGFMEPQRAMRDAYDDLRAHQFGFLAGMRAALEGILKRFDPAELEAKLTQKTSMLSALMPNKKKAQMWEVFASLYGQISSEAADDFHRLFGREFLRAYNEYVDQLEGR